MFILEKFYVSNHILIESDFDVEMIMHKIFNTEMIIYK